MKDQVDSLRQLGVAAEMLNSSVPTEQRLRIANRIRQGACRLLYVAPETLVRPQLLDFLGQQSVDFFAVDEAHCISAWGHDFRPEYRALSGLRERFADVPIHAYTATATPEVRAEVVATLGLRDPVVLVGDFFRSNLILHVARRNSINQIVSVIDRYRDQSGLIYCISRAETESLASSLRRLGYSCEAYHAGLSDDVRNRRQEAFINDETRILVATVAFGMGIDKPDVRFVIHAGMPKSLANYQQESGRAGRDGLSAECWLLHSGKDMLLWRRILESGPPDSRAAGESLLKSIHDYCVSTCCRHQQLVEHFGQTWSRGNCEACDICRGEFELASNPLELAQKILSCVIRVKENFGASYVAKVLAGSKSQDISDRGHSNLSTYGILKEYRLGDIRNWIEQLVAQDYLRREGEFNVLKVTDPGWQVLRGQVTPVLSLSTKRDKAATPGAIVDSWEGVDRALFEALRAWRRQVAQARSVPPYIIFGDVTLRDLARWRPTSLNTLRLVHGIGDKKLADFGAELIALIAGDCGERNVPVDQQPPESRPGSTSAAALAAFELFTQGCSVADVSQRLVRAESTVYGYLDDYIRTKQVTDGSPWINANDLSKIRAVAQYAGLDRLKPLHEALHGRIDYNQLRIAVAVLKNQCIEFVPE